MVNSGRLRHPVKTGEKVHVQFYMYLDIHVFDYTRIWHLSYSIIEMNLTQHVIYHTCI